MWFLQPGLLGWTWWSILRAAVVWLSFPTEDANPPLSAVEDSPRAALWSRLQGFQRGSQATPLPSATVGAEVFWSLAEAHVGLAGLG